LEKQLGGFESFVGGITQKRLGEALMKRAVLLFLVSGAIAGCGPSSNAPGPAGKAKPGETPPGVGAPPSQSQK